MVVNLDGGFGNSTSTLLFGCYFATLYFFIYDLYIRICSTGAEGETTWLFLEFRILFIFEAYGSSKLSIDIFDDYSGPLDFSTGSFFYTIFDASFFYTIFEASLFSSVFGLSIWFPTIEPFSLGLLIL